MLYVFRNKKLSYVDDVVIKAIWGDVPYGYSYQSTVGDSGGMVTV